VLTISTMDPRLDPLDQPSDVVALQTGPRRAGDTEATELDALFRLHYGRLVRALTLIAGDRELAADAVQEAFVKAHLRWRRLQHYDDPVGWIRRVAINRLRDGHRRRGRKEQALERLHGDATRGAHTDIDSTHEAMSRRTGDTDGVMALLQALPRQQRICVALFHVDGLSVAEVADALGISEGAVKFHLHQGRERLRSTPGLRAGRTTPDLPPPRPHDLPPHDLPPHDRGPRS
jgi:RNA polymerase sigma-70 factor (ECF subfamily)